MFVLAALLAVAASSLDLLVLTSILCTEKTAAAFTSFPVSLVGAVLRRSSSMLAIPLKRAFYLEKGDGGDSEGRSGGDRKIILQRTFPSETTLERIHPALRYQDLM